MSTNILASMSSLLNDSFVSKASAALGEPAAGIGTALRMAGPALLAGMMNKGATPSGSAELFRAVTSASVDEGIGSRIGKVLSDSAGTKQILSMGESLLSSMFGNRVSSTANAISQVAGVTPGTAVKALGLAAPMLFGLLKSQVAERGLNAQGLMSMLGQQRDNVLNAGLDERITRAMGIDNLRATVDEAYASPVRARVAEPVRTGARWWPWAIGAAAVALAVVLVANLFDREPDPNVAARAVASSDALPASIYFDRDQANIDGEDRRAIAAAADVAQASGNAVAITPVTANDNAGDQRLATQRAAAVREALIDEGLANDKVIVRPAEVAREAAAAPEAQRVEIALLSSGNELR